MSIGKCLCEREEEKRATRAGELRRCGRSEEVNGEEAGGEEVRGEAREPNLARLREGAGNRRGGEGKT